MYKKNSDIYAFYGREHPFSNHNHCEFVVTFERYSVELPRKNITNITHFKVTCGEQALMIYKALLFGDVTTLLKLMSTPYDPLEYKRLGRTVSGFVDEIWKEFAPKAMVAILYCKFTQHPTYADMLLDTHGRSLIEASTTDKYWGAGCSVNEANRKFPGNNEMGYCLEEVRSYLEAIRDSEDDFAPVVPNMFGPKVIILAPLTIKTKSVDLIPNYIDLVLECYAEDIEESVLFQSTVAEFCNEGTDDSVDINTIPDLPCSYDVGELFAVFKSIYHVLDNKSIMSLVNPSPYRFKEWFGTIDNSKTFVTLHPILVNKSYDKSAV